MDDQFDRIPPMNRRAWLRLASGVGAGAAGLPLLPAALGAEDSASPPVVRTPDEALRMLMEGNARFVRGDATVAKRSVSRLRELEAKQTPFASILACSDSRVPLEILFDQGFGDLFVARLAGNIATSAAIGSLEYGTRVLGSKLLMVLGHTACGAVSATMAMGEVPGQIGSLFPYIHPAAERVSQKHAGHGQPPLDKVIVENVRYQVEILRRASPVIAGLSRDGKLKVVGAIFHFGTGRVELIES
jgi:carbonic anhydrase